MHDTAATKRSLRVLTNSELKAQRRCAYERHLSYELGYRSAREDAEALRFGTLIHKALEAWWTRFIRGAVRSALEAALEVLSEAALADESDPFEIARAVQMIRGYSLRWENEPYEALEVECEFRAPLVNPATGVASRTYLLGGKIDVIARNMDDGLEYVVEHKTSSDDISTGSDYWQVLRLDTQVSTYYAGARALGYDPAGVLYDVLGKPKLRPYKATPIEERKYRKDGALYAAQRERDETPAEYEVRVCDSIAESPDRYYARGMVVRLSREESDAAWDTWQQSRLMREGELAKRWPRNPDACRRFGRMCTYFGVCTGVESLEDPAIFRRVDNVHEELTPELAPEVVP